MLKCTPTTPMSSVGWLLSSSFNSDVNRSAHLNLMRPKPGCVRSLSYDPVDVWPRIRQSESTLALHSNQTSACFRVNTRIQGWQV